jgi:hypothetical protein
VHAAAGLLRQGIPQRHLLCRPPSIKTFFAEHIQFLDGQNYIWGVARQKYVWGMFGCHSNMVA